jgi:hypothetical protein
MESFNNTAKTIELFTELGEHPKERYFFMSNLQNIVFFGWDQVLNFENYIESNFGIDMSQFRSEKDLEKIGLPLGEKEVVFIYATINERNYDATKRKKVVYDLAKDTFRVFGKGLNYRRSIATEFSETEAFKKIFLCRQKSIFGTMDTDHSLVDTFVKSEGKLPNEDVFCFDGNFFGVDRQISFDESVVQQTFEILKMVCHIKPDFNENVQIYFYEYSYENREFVKKPKFKVTSEGIEDISDMGSDAMDMINVNALVGRKTFIKKSLFKKNGKYTFDYVGEKANNRFGLDFFKTMKIGREIEEDAVFRALFQHNYLTWERPVHETYFIGRRTTQFLQDIELSMRVHTIIEQLRKFGILRKMKEKVNTPDEILDDDDDEYYSDEEE